MQVALIAREDDRITSPILIYAGESPMLIVMVQYGTSIIMVIIIYEE
jgi:hypothetical protein